MTILLLLNLLALNPARPEAPAPAVTITVRAASEVANRAFTVGEIAEVAGTDKTLAAQVTAVEVGPSPLPGLSRPLFGADIITHLRAARIDMKRVSLVLPPTIRITRGGSELPPDEVTQAAKDRLTADLAGMEGVTVEPGTVPYKWFVAAGKREYRAGEPRRMPDGRTAVVPVQVLVDGKPAKDVEITLRIRRMVASVVAARALPANTILTAGDLTMGQVEIAPGAPEPLADAQAVVGKKLTRSVAQGAPLIAAAVEEPPVIANGAKVTVEIVTGGVRISAPAVSRMPGKVGERIRVFVSETRRELTGVVVDAETVRVEEP